MEIKEYDNIKAMQNAIKEREDRIKELEEAEAYLKAKCEKLMLENAHMRGEIAGLSFAVRCGGIEGGEVKYDGEIKRI